MSFKGANPDIEKIMKRFTDPPPPKENSLLQGEKDADIGAEEVANTMSITKTISKKFAKKSQNRGFKRPNDDE